MRAPVVALVFIWASWGLAAPPNATPRRGTNLLRNPSFESAADSLAASWSPVGKGYALARDGGQAGKAAVACESAATDESHGAMQEIVFNPPVHHPFTVTGWSKARDARGADYCLYMDCWYADGTNLWGQRKSFEPGTHGWQQIQYTFTPAKPISRIQYFILFRRCSGKAWFDNVALSLAPFAIEGARATPSLYAGNSIDYSARLTLPGEWAASVLQGDREVYSVSGRGQGVSLAWAGTDKNGQLLPGGEYTVRLVAKDDLMGETLRRDTSLRTRSGEGRGYVAWTESSMRRVLINTLPNKIEDAHEARLALSGNEYESFQIAIRAAPGHDVNGCAVTVGDLKDNAGHMISAADVEWHQVGFVYLDQLFNHPKRPEEAVPGWWPDPLLPVGRFSVPGGVTQAIWFTVFAPPGTAPGLYHGDFKIIPANAPPLPVSVCATVYGFDIPTQPHIKTAFALMDGYLEKIYGKLTPALRQAYGDYVLKHRLNPDDISRTDPPDADDIAHYYNRGLNAFNVINMVAQRGQRAWVCYSPMSVYTPAFKAELVKKLDPYVADLKRRGTLDKAYVYTFDERGKEFWPIIKEYFGLIKERYGIPTLTTAKVPQDPQVMKDLNVDWNCPVSSVYKFDQAEECRKAGLQVWSYVCCGPRYPFANWLADDPLIEARLIWWQAYREKMDGFLYWGLNIWGRANNDYIIDPERDGPRLRWSITTERFHVPLHGDGDMLYPGKDGPFGCIRLANIRDGIEDYEYVGRLAELERSVEKGREACLPVTEDLTTFVRDPEKLYAQREMIARRIEELSRR